VIEALGKVIANTKRVRRKLSLVELAQWIETARRGLGGLRAVAERVGLSEEMLRQFATVNSLSPKVKKLVAERKIDRVDVAHRLSKLDPAEQYQVARLVAAGELDSDDVRAVITLRRSAPKIDIRDVVERVRSSRNIKEHVAYLAVPLGHGNIDALRARVAAVTGDENIRSFNVQGALGTLVLSSDGRNRLAREARARGLTKRKLIDAIVHGEQAKK
jgi:hypothetical protein